MADCPRRRPRVVKPGLFARHQKGQAISESQLRKLFNDRGILERAKTGEITTKVVKDAHPSPPMADEPDCTRSQLLAYYNLDGKKIAEAHQYLRTDGTIGGSGKPDPKELLHEGVLYFIERA